MKLAIIGTYPPRECGIGTFTKNLYNSIHRQDSDDSTNDSFIVAMNDLDHSYDYPEEVQYVIRQDSQKDYLAAAKYINVSGAECCILQHEFGIYGGQNGVYILPLLYRLEIPLVVTLHTVLKTPSFNEKAALQEICKMANRVVVMSKKAIDFLINIYDIPEEKIEFIEHGVPDLKFNKEETKQEFRLADKKLLLTFGLLSRNKGIETVIKALPEIIKRHPNVFYLIVGKTHPAVLRHSGDEYRIYLTRLVNKLKLQRHVAFINKFVSQRELFKYLHASDVYITPYLNEAQITSGTLAYAVGVGTAVVSTPYWHASELLDEGRGILFDFNDHEGLADVIIDLFEDNQKRMSLRQKAHEYGREITWPKIGDKYLKLLEKVVVEDIKIVKKEMIPFDIMLLPPFTMAHVKRMTDDTGIIQHAKYGIPNLKEGYCLDDNARALLMSVMTINQKNDQTAFELCPVYLSYIHYMQNKDGTFRNFMSFKRDYLDEVGSEDSFGRTIWALGHMLANAPNDSYYQVSKLMFVNAIPAIERLESIRSIANSVIGVCHYLEVNPSDEAMMKTLRKILDKLVVEYDNHSSEGWEWFEDELTYDNAILPLAMLHATSFFAEEKIKNIAMASMNFLTELTMSEGYLSVVGNQNWYKKGEERPRFAQQPIDAMAMVLMYHRAFIVTKEEEYLNKLFTAFMWFLGENDLRLSLYDYETGGCCDGLESYGVNRNQGAESLLAYMISYLTVLEVYEEYYS